MAQREAGLSSLGMLLFVVMLGFFVMCGIRMAPSYIEYLSIKEIVTKVATEEGAEEATVADLRRKIDTLFNTNQIYDVKPSEIEIFRKEGKMYIDANYESRVPVVGPIDAIIRFDDLSFTIDSKR